MRMIDNSPNNYGNKVPFKMPHDAVEDEEVSQEPSPKLSKIDIIEDINLVSSTNQQKPVEQDIAKTPSGSAALDSIANYNQAAVIKGAVAVTPAADNFKALSSNGVTVNTTDPTILAGVTISKDSATGEVTISGLKGTSNNLVKVTVDDAVAAIKLVDSSNASLDVNSKTKLSVAGIVDNAVFNPRFDIDVDPTKTPTVVNTSDHGELTGSNNGSSSADRTFTVNYNEKTGARGGSVGFRYANSDPSVNANKERRISQLVALGVKVNPDDPDIINTVYNMTTKQILNGIINDVVVTKDPATGAINISGLGKGKLEDLIAKTKAKIPVATPVPKQPAEPTLPNFRKIIPQDPPTPRHLFFDKFR